jgi:hypothetical protein
MTKAWHLAATAVYLAIALWVIRPVLPALADSYPCWATLQQNPIGDGDQSHMIWAASRNARTVVTAPWRLWDFEICYPFPKAVALGHHLYANGLVGLVPYGLTHEPILTLNVAVVAMLWVSAVGMYALAYHWTRSVPAAFVAGLLFAFTPQRLFTARWPAIVGNQWTPLALLFAHRLFDRGRWRDAAGLAVFVGMQVLESFYQMVPLAVLGAVYGIYLLVQHRRHLLGLAPKLLAVCAATAAVTTFVAVPYVEVRATWNTLAGHMSFLPFLNDLAPGKDRYPGTVLVVLAGVGLLDRLRGRRGDDPRVIYLVAGLLLLSLMVRWPVTLGLTIGLAAAGLTEVFHPTFAMASFGTTAEVTAFPLSVPREVVRLADERFGDGAVLDLPAENPALGFRRRGHYVLLAAFHGRPTTGCFTSFESPLAARVEAMGVRLPDRRAAAALHALGFRSVILHEEELLGPRQLRTVTDNLARLATGDPRLVELGAVDGHRLYRLESTAPVRSDLALLAAGTLTAMLGPVQHLTPPAGPVALTFRNPGPATFRHPDPIAPSPLLARWYDPGGALVLEHRVKEVLPLALAAGDAVTQRIEMPVPAAPGQYRVTLTPAATPDVTVAVGLVAIGPIAPGGS